MGECTTKRFVQGMTDDYYVLCSYNKDRGAQAVCKTPTSNAKC